MLIPTVIAVALGVAPVGHDGFVKLAADYSRAIGQYSQVVDDRGTTHIKGRDRHGQPYQLVVSKTGYVEASYGEREISFHVRDAS